MEGAAAKDALGGYASLFRLGNCAMGALGALLAAVICAGLEEALDYWMDIVLSMVVVATFTAAGNAYNDFFDREVDKAAHPERPIPSGAVTPYGASVAANVLFAVSLALSFFINEFSVFIVVTSVMVMVVYERFLKAEGLAGNLAISWLTGALFLFGGAAVEKFELAWILAVLAFLATLGREIIKDIQDIEGDKGTRKTLPMRIGVRKAGQIGSAALVGAVVLSPLPYLLELLSVWYVPVVVVADGIFIYCALIHFRDPEKGQNTAKLAMFVALLAFLVGGVF